VWVAALGALLCALGDALEEAGFEPSATNRRNDDDEWSQRRDRPRWTGHRGLYSRDPNRHNDNTARGDAGARRAYTIADGGTMAKNPSVKDITGQFYSAGELMELVQEADELEWPQPERRGARARIAWLALAAASAVALLVLAIVAA
jgi:hypothetical protein